MSDPVVYGPVEVYRYQKRIPGEHTIKDVIIHNSALVLSVVTTEVTTVDGRRVHKRSSSDPQLFTNLRAMKTVYTQMVMDLVYLDYQQVPIPNPTEQEALFNAVDTSYPIPEAQDDPLFIDLGE